MTLLVIVTDEKGKKTNLYVDDLCSIGKVRRAYEQITKTKNKRYSFSIHGKEFSPLYDQDKRFFIAFAEAVQHKKNFNFSDANIDILMSSQP